MVDSISSQISSGALTSAVGGNEGLGQEAFLKLLVAQLQNQDPLNPQENYEFVAQLAQFSSLEQTIGINDRLDQLSLQSRGLQNSQVVSLVGKTATVKGNIVSLEGQGARVPINFSLDSAAARSLVEVRDSSGRRVTQIEVGPRSAGNVSVQWDGRSQEGLSQPAGPYQVVVTAFDAADNPVSVVQQSSGSVESVSFSQGFPVIRLDNGVTAPVADLLEVSPSTNNP